MIASRVLAGVRCYYAIATYGLRYWRDGFKRPVPIVKSW